MTNQNFYALSDNNLSSFSGGTQAMWNMYDKSGNVLLSNENRNTSKNGTTGCVRATIGKSSGRWYWEIKFTSTSPDMYMGVATIAATLSSSPNSQATCWTIATDGGDYYNNGFIGNASGVWPAVNLDVLGFALNMDAGSLTLYRNNTVLTPTPLFTGLTGTIYPLLFIQNNANTATVNFGPTGMSYSPPAGFNEGLYDL